jgi:AcrR family transcriptional regulator
MKRYSTELRQTQIVNAAREIIVKYGSENITIRRIAQNVGISEAAIYRHFKNKRDILSHLISKMDEVLIEDIETVQTQHPSYLQSLNETIILHLSGIQQRKGIYFQVLAEIISLGDKKLNNHAAKVVDRYINRIAELIKEGIRSGELKSDINPRVAATMLFGMIQGLVNLWAVNNYGFDLVDKYAPLWQMFRDLLENKIAQSIR